MSRDALGNCNICPEGEFQPNDLPRESDSANLEVGCTACKGGTFANQVLDVTEFSKELDFLSMEKCTTVTPHASNRLCQLKPRKWRSHIGELILDTGLIPGMRVSIGGNITVTNELGGFIRVYYSTANLRENESFLILLNGI